MLAYLLRGHIHVSDMYMERFPHAHVQLEGEYYHSNTSNTDCYFYVEAKAITHMYSICRNI